MPTLTSISVEEFILRTLNCVLLVSGKMVVVIPEPPGHVNAIPLKTTSGICDVVNP